METQTWGPCHKRDRPFFNQLDPCAVKQSINCFCLSNVTELCFLWGHFYCGYTLRDVEGGQGGPRPPQCFEQLKAVCSQQTHYQGLR